ncbi:MAG: c-type cytochrome [Planctomycetes bacterium]|nr:c-type cytochrome [Planctomycetota bacterium]
MPSPILAALVAAPLSAAPLPTPTAPSLPQEVSDEARQVLARMQLPEGFRAEVFASEPMLANPVAFCFDVFGRVYVAETFRHHKGVTDIRSHMGWLEDDLAIKSVADRVAMFRKHEGEDGLRDGYSVETERITRLVDTDGDGVADEATAFADDFADPAAGIGAGLLARRRTDGATELWFTCIPDLWRLLDEDGDGVAEDLTRHSTGYGLRVALLGHDLHGLVIGPDGRLYFSIGDRGFNVTTDEGEQLVRYGTGAVFRCELDGSNLEIFCDGLRNPQELAFDDSGNLFTLDNNSDGGDQARWTYLLRGSDTGWRQAYQWVRQPTARGPWNQERLWYPYFEGQPLYLLPPIANFTSGPSGLTTYPGTGWGDRWHDTFFVCDFRGNPGYSGIYSFRNAPDGAGFRAEEIEKFVWDALPTDVDFGVDGNLYFSDWVSGWNQTGKGRMFRVSPEARDEAEVRLVAEVATLLQGGLDELDDGAILALFEHRDRRVRQEAQLLMASRILSDGNEASAEARLARLLEVVTAREAQTLQRVHALWCAGHVGRLMGGEGVSAMLRSDSLDEALLVALRDPDPEVIVQALRVSAERDATGLVQEALGLLRSHPEARVRLLAAEALGRPALPAELGAAAFDELVELLGSEGAGDPWLRTAAICALDRMGATAPVAGLQDHPDAFVRQCAVVVLRRQGDRRIAKFLADPAPAVRAEAARGIHDAPVAAAMGALSAATPVLAEGGDSTTIRRALHASREVATLGSASRLLEFALDEGAEPALRAEALRVLASWTRPLTRDGVVMDHRPIPAAQVGDLRGAAMDVAAGEALGRLTRSPALADRGVGTGLLELIASLDLPEPEAAGYLAAVADQVGADAEVRRRAYRRLLRVAPGASETAALTARAAVQAGNPLRSAALLELHGADAISIVVEEAREGAVERRADALRVLAGFEDAAASAAFLDEGARLKAEDHSLLVEWLLYAGENKDDSIKASAAAMEAEWEASEDPLARWRMCLEGGDAERGQRIFASKAETSCMKCHVVGDEGGSEAGPAMDDVGKRLTAEQLLHAIVEPNAEIAEGFESWLIMTDEDETFSGRILEEDAEVLLLETSKKEQLEFEIAEIKARRRDVSAMPSNVSSHLSRAEMRDVIAFLSSLRGE